MDGIPQVTGWTQLITAMALALVSREGLVALYKFFTDRRKVPSEIDEINARVKKIGVESDTALMQAATGLVGDLRTTLQETKAEIKELRAQHKQDIAEVKAEHDKCEKDLASHKEQLIKVEKRLSEVCEEITELRKVDEKI